MAALRILSASGRAFRKVIIWISGNEADVASSPTITAGAGVPGTVEPNGSIFLRTDNSAANDAIYSRIGGAWVAIDGT